MKFRVMGSMAAVCLLAATAFAAVAVDENGVGFVGKGDIQLLFDWNNAQLQASAAGLAFRWTVVEATSWDCEKDGKKEKSVQSRTRTATIEHTVAFDARKNNKGQITGFNLNGVSGTSEVSEGPPLHSCPGGAGWHLVEGSTSTEATSEGLQVSADGSDWRPLGQAE